MEIAITLNISESRKNNFLVIETYCAKGRINKQGKYVGGSISPIDIDTIFDMSLKKILSKECTRIGKNSFYICAESFGHMFSTMCEKYMFLIDNPDRSMYLIKKFETKLPVQKLKPLCKIGNLELFYTKDNTLCCKEDSKDALTICEQIPTPLIKFDETEKIYELWFDYNGCKKAFADRKFSISTGTIVYVVSFDYEIEICEKLEKIGFVKLTRGRFVYSGGLNKSDLRLRIMACGINIEDRKDVILPKIEIKAANNDWFEVDLTCRINGEVIDLASQINLFASKKQLLFEDKKILLPESIALACEENRVTIENNKLKIHKSNILQLLRIFYEAGVESDNFFAFSDVKLALPSHISNLAFPYQLEGVQWLKFLFLNNLGGCLADDMGLGKTFQTIALLNDGEVKKQIKKILIVVPKSLLTNWKKEFEKFSSNYRVGIYHGERRNELKFDNFDVIITTYATACLDIEFLSEMKFTIAIFDEIQYIKNYKAITSDKIKSLNANVKFGLSGTPMENNLSELWNVMDVLNPGVFGSHTSFLTRYRDRNRDELKKILNLFVLRRLKQKVLMQLPEKREHIIYCDMDNAQRTLYTSINYAVKSAISSMRVFSSSVVLKGLLLLRQCCCHPQLLDKETNPQRVSESCKLDTLKMLVETSINCGHKILIFSQFTSMLSLIRQELTLYEDILFYLDGRTQNREKIVSDFEKSENGIFLISIKAGGVGLNLTSAEDVIIFDPWWNPFVEQQAIDRAYRIGQNQKVNVYKLVAANTLEEKIVEMQKEKQDVFDEVINGISENKNIDIHQILKLL